MPKIKHIGISTRDPAGTVDFLTNAFGLTVIERDENSAVVTDGYINITILGFIEDRYGGGTPGLHHIGFHVEDMDQAGQKVEEAGGWEVKWWNDAHGNSEGTPDNWVGEKKYTSPEGIALDVNATGWQNRPGGLRGKDGVLE